MEQPEEQRDHHPADRLHEMDMQADTGEAAERFEHHPVAAGEQQQDGGPDPGKEFLKRDAHQPHPLRRIERAERLHS